MKTARSIAALALFAVTAAACATERVAAPQRSAAPLATSSKMALLPLLYVVDGVRLGRDQVPDIQASRVASVEVIKGRAALERFGADASYGVVLITTKQ